MEWTTQPELFLDKALDLGEQITNTVQPVFIITEVSEESVQTVHTIKIEPEEISNDELNLKLETERERANLKNAILIATESQGEKAARRAKINERDRIKRKIKNGNDIERAMAIEALKKLDLERKLEKEKLRPKKTPEEKAEYNKIWRQNKILRESQEQTQIRRARDAEQKRKRLQNLQKKLNITEDEAEKFVEEQRKIMREKDRMNRLKREARLTPEQKEARRIKMNEKDRLKRERIKKENPEKFAAIRARVNARRKIRRALKEKPPKVKKTENLKEYQREYRKEYRRQLRLKETPEEKADRRLKDCELAKINRQKKIEARRLNRQKKLEEKKRKTPKKRPTKSLIEKREQKRKTKAARYAALTPEEKESYRLKSVEGLRRFREKQRRTLTAEQRAEHTRKDSERTRRYRQKQRALYTLEQRREKRAAYIASLPPEEREKRELKKAERIAKQRQKLQEEKANLTPEQIVARNIIKAAQSKIYRERRKQKVLAKTQKIPLTQQPDCIDDIKVESESFQETSFETIPDLSSEDMSLTSTTKFYRLRDNCDIGQTSSSNIESFSAQSEKSGSSMLIKNGISYMREMIDFSAGRDKHSAYGEHIANRIRTSNRNDHEVYIAKQLIDNVLQNLSTGTHFQ